MDKYKVYNLVYSSSATVYGAPPQCPIPESSPLQPESCYGRTKFMSELIIKDVCDSAPEKWRAISLRYFNPAGAHPSGQIGEDPRGRPGNLLPLLAQMAVGKFPEGLKIFGNDYDTPDGTCVRDYIHSASPTSSRSSSAAAAQRSHAAPSTDSCSFLQSWTSPRVTSSPSPRSPATRSTLRRARRPASARRAASTRRTTSVRARACRSSTWSTPCRRRRASSTRPRSSAAGASLLLDSLSLLERWPCADAFSLLARSTGDVPELTADPALAEKELEFKAKRDLEAMCRDQWNWQSCVPSLSSHSSSIASY